VGSDPSSGTVLGEQVDLDEKFDIPGTEENRVAGPETPFVVIPRGGCRQVGRSCYHVQTREGDYLVDCGIAQGQSAVDYPDFQGIDERSIDAVFLTHAHIDHTGALPIVEHQDLLAEAAPVIATRPTGALAHVLLHDSLKIHQDEAREMGQDQEFTRDDVHDVLGRMETLQYAAGEVGDFVSVDDEALRFKFGNAGHLLGSAWLALETGGRRIVFSGDLGGRSAHLPDIEGPPSADTLVLESTYGDRPQHTGFNKARQSLIGHIQDAVNRGIPVLIPTFAVGRAQEILQTLRDYRQELPDDFESEVSVIYDGMAQDATDRYHAFATGEYVSESVMNYKMNSGDAEPFLPKSAYRPTEPDERPQFLDGEGSPIVIAPSGMLTGGLSPLYLLDLTRNYEEAKVLFVGYQAEGTPGRTLQDADGETCHLDLEITDWGENDYSGGHTASVPTDWIHTIKGLSGHAAGDRLMQFAREVDPSHIALVHGEASRQREFQSFLDGNVNTDSITLTGIHSPFAVGEADGTIHLRAGLDRLDGIEPSVPDPVSDSETESVDDVVDQEAPPEEQVRQLRNYVRHLEREVASLHNDDGWTEAELRQLIRNEIDSPQN
jgi:predicted metal-dependent RNase